MAKSRLGWASALLLMALMSPHGRAVARGDDGKPEDLLERHGLSLKRGGSNYVLAGETDAQQKLAEVQRSYKLLGSALARQFELDREVDFQKRAVPELLRERILLNQQLQAINGQDVFMHNQVVARLNEINDQLRLLDGNSSNSALRQSVDKAASQRRAAFIQAVLDLRELVDATTRKYAELAKDETVKTALAALAAKSKAPVKLGPSRGFEETVKQLVLKEKSVLVKAIEMKRSGGVFEVDVTLNGKETTPMIFDTGASIVVLPAEFAVKIGLTPQSSDPTIELRDATGGVTEAKKMTIATVRVGPFTANNVACAVMPPNKRDAPLLLGQSFISRFTHKVENGRLILSAVDTGEPQTKASGTPKKTSRSKRSKAAPGASASASDSPR